MRLAKRSFAWNAPSCAMQSSALQGMRRRRKAKQSKASPFKALLPPVPEVKGDASCKAPLCKAQRMGFAPEVLYKAPLCTAPSLHLRCNATQSFVCKAKQSNATDTNLAVARTNLYVHLISPSYKIPLMRLHQRCKEGAYKASLCTHQRCKVPHHLRFVTALQSGVLYAQASLVKLGL